MLVHRKVSLPSYPVDEKPIVVALRTFDLGPDLVSHCLFFDYNPAFVIAGPVLADALDVEHLITPLSPESRPAARPPDPSGIFPSAFPGLGSRVPDRISPFAGFRFVEAAGP